MKQEDKDLIDELKLAVTTPARLEGRQERTDFIVHARTLMARAIVRLRFAADVPDVPPATADADLIKRLGGAGGGGNTLAIEAANRLRDLAFGPLPFRLSDEDVARLVAAVEESTARMLKAANVTLGHTHLCGSRGPYPDNVSCDSPPGHAGWHGGSAPGSSSRQRWQDIGAPQPRDRYVTDGFTSGGGAPGVQSLIDALRLEGERWAIGGGGGGEPSKALTPEERINVEISQALGRLTHGECTPAIVEEIRARIYCKAFGEVLTDLRIAVAALRDSHYAFAADALAAIKTQGL
jgi:hypothetical protein